jgi:predicted transcriptional regulator
MTNPHDPYSGVDNERITQYQAGALEQRVLHTQTADPLRTPTYTLFPKPDYFFSTSGPNVSINSGFAYDHGYYSPNIDITWSGMVGPGVAKKGVDGPEPAGGNQAHDPESTKTVPEASQVGTWVEEADLRPTMLHLAGLSDDYQSDGHVITQALSSTPPALATIADLAKGYDQINSSVGQFATDTLIADSKALASGSASDDSAYMAEQETLQQLADDRDSAAARIKETLADAAAGQMPNHGEIQSGLMHVKELLKRAHALATQ